MKETTSTGAIAPETPEEAKQFNPNGTTGTIAIPVSNPYGIVTIDDLLSEVKRRFDKEKRLKNAAFSFLVANGLYGEFHEYLHDGRRNEGDTAEDRLETSLTHFAGL